MPATIQNRTETDVRGPETPGDGARSRRTAVAVARVEGVRLIRHPMMLVAIALAAIYAWVLVKDLAPVMVRDTVYLASTSAPIAIAALIVAHLATSRPRHDGTEDLYEASPAQLATRTAGILLAGLWPAAVGLVYVLAWVGYLYAGGGIGHPNPFDLLAIPAFVGAGGVAGVALGRWVPSRIAGPLVAVVLFAGHGLLMFPSFGSGLNLARLTLHTDWGSMGFVPELLPRAPGIHLVYVLGVAMVVAAAALMRHRRGPAGPVLAAVGVVVAGASGGWLVQPLPEDRVEDLVSLATDPSPALECETRERVEYCVLPRYSPWIGRWHDTIGGVIAAFPPGDRPEQLRVEMSLEDAVGYLGVTLFPNLDAEQRLRLLTGDIARDQVPLRVGTSLGGRAGDSESYALALTVSSLLLDIGAPVVIDLPDPDASPEPPGPDAIDESRGAPDHIRCTPAGQAREVIALYLAAQSSPAAQSGFARHLEEQPSGLRPDSDDPAAWQDRLHVQPRFVDTARDRHETLDTAWSLSAAALAAQLLERSTMDVLGVLHQDWEHWTDPSTSRGELVEHFDLRPLPTVDEAATAAGIDTTPGGPTGAVARTPSCT